MGECLFLFPVAGVWSNKELYVARAEPFALCSQVQRDQGLAAPLALHWPVPTQQVTAETCPEVHGDTSERNTGPGVQSKDSDSDEVKDLAFLTLRGTECPICRPDQTQSEVCCLPRARVRDFTRKLTCLVQPCHYYPL